MLHGSINHASITVSNLREAITFFDPFLGYLGYRPEPANPQSVQIYLLPATGAAVNLWQAKPELRDRGFEVYAPGLHHLAFNVASADAVDALAELVPGWGGSILDSPAEYGYTSVGTYYAVNFTGPDGIKLECVYMSELHRQYEAAGISNHRIWPHAVG